MKLIDLHVHTTASDGTLEPENAARCAAEHGLSAIAVTDHDTVAGIGPALSGAESSGVEIVPGIELSARYCSREIHILGYFIDHRRPSLLKTLEGVVAGRRERNREMIRRLENDGYPVSEEKLTNRYGTGAVIGRPHVAEMLCEAGCAASVDDAFDSMLSKGKKYFVPRPLLTVDEAMSAIRGAGGLPVLAHPILFSRSETVLEELLSCLMPRGLEGIEAYYSKYTAADQELILALAGRFGLAATGGSDYHGGRKPDISIGTGRGNLAIPYPVLEELRARR